MGRLRWKVLVAVPLVCLLLAFAGRAFVGQVLVLRSGSMEPDLLGSGASKDWVLVLYGPPDSWERGDLAVFRQSGAEAPAVKRVAGLPGESAQLSGGDLFIDGERRSVLGDEALWVPWWGPGAEGLEEWFERDDTEGGPWSQPEPGVERLDALEIGAASNRGSMFLRYDVDLGYLRPDGTRVRETEQANDLRVRLELRLNAGPAEVGEPGIVRLELVEEADQFRLELQPGAAGSTEVRLARRSGNRGGFEVLKSATTQLPVGAWHALEFSNRDNRLAARLDGEDLLGVGYAENEAYRGDLPIGAKSVGPRVAIGGSRVSVDLRAIGIDRDAFYLTASAFGDYGIGRPLRLGPDELFLLGDHSTDSLDGRRFGAVGSSEIVGRAAAIVWPPSRWRRLGRR